MQEILSYIPWDSRNLTHRELDKAALTEVIAATKLLKEERKITSHNLALVLVHDLLLAKGIQVSRLHRHQDTSEEYRLGRGWTTQASGVAP